MDLWAQDSSALGFEQTVPSAHYVPGLGDVLGVQQGARQASSRPHRNVAFQLEEEAEQTVHEIVTGAVRASQEENKSERDGFRGSVHRKALYEEVILGDTRGRKGSSHVESKGKHLDRRNSKCKGPEAGKGLTS